jgi:hypothetical protein
MIVVAHPKILSSNYAAKARDRRARSRSEHLGIDERPAQRLVKYQKNTPFQNPQYILQNCFEKPNIARA